MGNFASCFILSALLISKWLSVACVLTQFFSTIFSLYTYGINYFTFTFQRQITTLWLVFFSIERRLEG